MSGGNSEGLKGQYVRPKPKPKPKPRPGRSYSAQDVADKVNQRLDEE